MKKSALLIAAVGAITLCTSQARAQDPLVESIVVLDGSSTTTKTVQDVARQQADLDARRLHAALRQIVPRVPGCCNLPEQFTLTPWRPMVNMGRARAYVETWVERGWVLTNLASGGICCVREAQWFTGEGAELRIDIVLQGLKPDYNYLLDFRAESLRHLGTFTVGSQRISPIDGHVLIVLPTDSRGLGMALLYTTGPTSVWDVKISEIGPR